MYTTERSGRKSCSCVSMASTVTAHLRRLLALVFSTTFSQLHASVTSKPVHASDLERRWQKELQMLELCRVA